MIDGLSFLLGFTCGISVAILYIAYAIGKRIRITKITRRES